MVDARLLLAVKACLADIARLPIGYAMKAVARRGADPLDDALMNLDTRLRESRAAVNRARQTPQQAARQQQQFRQGRQWGAPATPAELAPWRTSVEGRRYTTIGTTPYPWEMDLAPLDADREVIDSEAEGVRLFDKDRGRDRGDFRMLRRHDTYRRLRKRMQDWEYLGERGNIFSPPNQPFMPQPFLLPVKAAPTRPPNPNTAALQAELRRQLAGTPGYVAGPPNPALPLSPSYNVRKTHGVGLEPTDGWQPVGWSAPTALNWARHENREKLKFMLGRPPTKEEKRAGMQVRRQLAKEAGQRFVAIDPTMPNPGRVGQSSISNGPGR